MGIGGGECSVPEARDRGKGAKEIKRIWTERVKGFVYLLSYVVLASRGPVTAEKGCCRPCCLPKSLHDLHMSERRRENISVSIRADGRTLKKIRHSARHGQKDPPVTKITHTVDAQVGRKSSLLLSWSLPETREDGRRMKGQMEDDGRKGRQQSDEDGDYVENDATRTTGITSIMIISRAGG